MHFSLSVLCSILAKKIFAYIFYKNQQQNKYNEKEFESVSTSIAVYFMFCQAFWRNDFLSPFCVPFMQFLHAEIYLSVMWGTESSNAAARIGRRELLQGSMIKWSCCNMLQLEKGEILDTQQQTTSVADYQFRNDSRLSCFFNVLYIIILKLHFYVYVLSFTFISHSFLNNAPKNIDKMYFTNKSIFSSLWSVTMLCMQITFVCVKPNNL